MNSCGGLVLSHSFFLFCNLADTVEMVQPWLVVIISYGYHFSSDLDRKNRQRIRDSLQKSSWKQDKASLAYRWEQTGEPANQEWASVKLDILSTDTIGDIYNSNATWFSFSILYFFMVNWFVNTLGYYSLSFCYSAHFLTLSTMFVVVFSMFVIGEGR